MISAADFKKQISKTLAGHLKTLGFKGSGFNYLMDSDNFVFTIGIQASRWGGQCCAEFGIQPRDIDGFGGYKIDFKKLKHYQCEFRTRLSKKGGTGEWWQYSDDPQQNIQIENEIFDIIVQRIVPIISLFKSSDFVLDSIEVSDLDNIFKFVADKFGGMSLLTTDIRFAWALTKVYEQRNIDKARQFAKFGLSKLDDTSTFLGKQDFERVLTENNSAKQVACSHSSSTNMC